MVKHLGWISLVVGLTVLMGCQGAALWSDNQVQKAQGSSSDPQEVKVVHEDQPEMDKLKSDVGDGKRHLSSPDEVIKDERKGLVPVRIKIPAIDVDAPVEHLGLLSNGRMQVPDGYKATGWFEPGTKPGSPGNAVIAGHVDDTVNPAVFYRLKELKVGDEILLYNQEGKLLTFVVYRKAVFPYDDAPVQELFEYSHRSLLNLITCIGDYSPDINGRQNRLVVYTELKEYQDS